MATDNRHSLSEFPRPNLTVDAIVLCVYRGVFSVALHLSPDFGWCLPGTFVREGESLVDAVDRGLREKLRLTEPVGTFRQLQVFDSPNRDPRGWVFSVAHYAVVPERVLDDVPPKQVVPVTEAMKMDLAFDHSAMLAMAVQRVREEYFNDPDPWDILGAFTLRELRDLHEAIDESTHLRDTFRRVMEPKLIELSPDEALELLAQRNPHDGFAKFATPLRVQMGRPSRMWRIPNAEERLMQRYASKTGLAKSRAVKSGRPESSTGFSQEAGNPRARAPQTFALTTPDVDGVPSGLFSTSESIAPERVSHDRMMREPSQPRYSVEFTWSESGSVRHDDLRRREAFSLFNEFVADTARVSPSLQEANRPVRARIFDDFGQLVAEHEFAL